MALVRVMHERVSGGSHTVLAVYALADGSHVYGVSRDGRMQMTGTKAEAKAFYGNSRKL
jgi:hypothetical protein